MYQLFDRVTSHEDNVVIVIGTEGNVIPINAILKGTDCKKILCNLKPNKAIKHWEFTDHYFEPATTALPKINAWLERYEVATHQT
jgi:hypothetical protein